MKFITTATSKSYRFSIGVVQPSGQFYSVRPTIAWVLLHTLTSVAVAAAVTGGNSISCATLWRRRFSDGYEESGR